MFLVIVMLSSSFCSRKDAKEQLVPNKVLAPDFQVKDLSGESFKLSDTKGKFVVLNFWATWCSPCKKEMPSLVQLSKDYPQLIVLALSYKEDVVVVNKYVEKNKIPFHVLLDEDGKVFQSYKIFGLPTTYLINSRGEIVGTILNAVDWQSAEMKDVITVFLEGKLVRYERKYVQYK